MSRCMYDYAVEMMKNYHEEKPYEFRIKYDKIASQLAIQGKDGRRQVSSDIKERFYGLYQAYVETLDRKSVV